ncbi:MAG: hypothetical protein ACYDBB_18595, partial [Armatimonadota bacterium]
MGIPAHEVPGCVKKPELIKEPVSHETGSKFVTVLTSTPALHGQDGQYLLNKPQCLSDWATIASSTSGPLRGKGAGWDMNGA